MASSVYKWLIPALLGFMLTGAKSAPDAPHPFHVAVVELEHNAADKTFEISCKLFTDDFEKVLTQNYKTKVDLIHPTDKSSMDSLVKKYVLSHLSITADNKQVSFSYLGFEHENEAVYGYFQVDGVPSVKKIDMVNTLMQDLFEDQVNLMHVKVGGERKSVKLDYPKKNASFVF
jgi:hypothetical protein